MKTAKKLLCLLLSVLTVFMCTVPAFAQQTQEEYPIILVGGMRDDLVDADGNQIYPSSVDLTAHLREVLPDCMRKLLVAYMTDDWTSYGKAFTEALKPVFAQIQVDGDGEIKDGSHAKWTWTKDTLCTKTSGYEMNDYSFEYDWRVSSYDVAVRLNEYIEAVCEVTGKSKVNLVGRCLGANVVLCYFDMFGTDRVETLALHVPGAEGNSFLGAVFTGDLSLNSDTLDTFMTSFSNNYSLVGDPALQEVLVAFVSLMNQVKVLGLGTEAIEEIYSHLKETEMPEMLRTSFGSFGTIWDCIAPEYYEQAKDFVFNTPELKEEYAPMLAKADKYNYEIKTNVRDLLKYYSDIMNIEIIAKYNCDIYPVFDGSNVQGDGLIELEKLSFGATTVNMGETLSPEYIQSRVDAGKDKYISKDLIVDASTCLFPDNTWFIRDVEHMNWLTVIDDFITDLIKAGGDLTVWDTPNYPQFMKYNSKTNALEAVTEPLTPSEDRWNSDVDSSMISFIVNIIKMVLTRIFSIFGNLFK